MKTTNPLPISVCLLFLTTLLQAATTYTKDPTICTNIKGVYCDNTKVATFSKLPVTLEKTWCAYAHDETWTKFDDISSSWVPGQTIYTSTPIPGTNLLKGSGIVALSVWNTGNTITGSKSEDCAATLKPSNFDANCNPVTDKMCATYDAKVLSKNIITYTGLNNYSIGVWCGFTDDAWSSYADLTPILIGGVDVYNLDAANYSYASGGAKSGLINLPLNGTVDMLAHAKMPDQCKKSFTLKGTGNSRTDVSTPAANLATAYPNPAISTETITITGDFSTNATLTILDMNSSIVATSVVTNSQTIQLNLSEFSLKTGIYIVKIQGENQTNVAKLIIK